MTDPKTGSPSARLAGRERELARVEDFLAAPNGEARALVIRGPAGIGKSAIWRAALDRMRAAGQLVLVARPAEEELRGTMIGLLDLFDEIDADPTVLDPDTDLFERGRAVLSTLRRLTEADSVVLAIDDLQWLDPISVRALRYALRRLEDRPVWVVATERTGTADGARLAVLSPERTEELTLGVLPIEAIRQVLTPVTPTISRPALELVHELSGGNPMYALELARSTDLNRDRLAASSRQTLDSTLSARIAATPPAIRHVVQTAAALGPASPERLWTACAEPDARDRLADAIDRGLLTLDDSMLVRCSHPLLGSVALGDMDPEARRALHAGLAEVVTDPDDRARHLALAAVDRDAGRAAELEEAANRAGRRGAPPVAAELAAHSLRLTPIDDLPSLARRAVAEILHRAAAGETGRAIAMIDAIVDGLPPGPDRFAALILRVRIDAGSAEQVLAHAQDEADTDELARGRILDLLGYETFLHRGRLDRARELVAEAHTIARRHDDAELEMLSAATLSNIAVLAGNPEPELMERALELGRQVKKPRLGRWPDVEWARQCLWAGRIEEARDVFTRLQAMAARSGLEFQRPFRALDLALLEIAAGRLTVAAELVDDGLESALDAGNASITIWLRYPDGLAHAHLGSDDSRVGLAVAEMRSWGIEHGEHTRVLMAHHVAGVSALARGDGQVALSELLAGVALSRRLGFAHPGLMAVLPDAIEAAAMVGTAALADDLADELEAQAAALRLPWVDAAARRGRALAAVAAGTVEPDQFAAAAAAFDSLGYRLDAARSLWWHGRALQRVGRRRRAADALADAHDRFSAMSATPWAEQATAELERVAPGRATGSLTAEEARIAALVAEGRRNREIAADLFVSVATVEAHLTRIYRKLGIRSRTELSRHLLQIIALGARDVGYVPERDPAIAGVGPAPLWGRDREVEQLQQLVRSIDEGARFVVIRGDVGIGKTAVWRWAVDQHRVAGHLVLVTRPAHEELHGPMTGLLDLFEDADPAPGTLDPEADVFDRGRAVLRTLRSLASSGPVAVAIDDIQWLDAISARALRYAFRRLDREPVVMLATERPVADERPELVVPPDRVEQLVLGPLSLDAIRHVVRTVVASISRPALERVYELSGGNPLYAIELARSGESAAGPLGAAAPPTLRGVLAVRLADAPEELLAVLRTAAALGPAPAADLARACDDPGAARPIAAAIEEGLLMAGDDGVVRFTHPLLASVVLDGTNPLERTALHARLAAVVIDRDARARHLALSCGEPDEAVAAELEAAAERAARRGAAAVAAELARHSLRVTPRGDTAEAARRALAGISYRAAAGETAMATAMIDDLLDRHEPGPARVEAITQRVYLDIDRGEEFLVRALGESGDDMVLRGRVLDLLGWLLGMYRGQLERGIALSAEALGIAEQNHDPVLEMLAAGTLSTVSLMAGRPLPGVIERALSLAAVHEGPLLGRWPSIFRARQCLWAGHLAEAKERFEAMRDAFGRRGVEFQRPYRLSELAQAEVNAGNLDRALDLADDALEAAFDASNPQASAWVRYPAGLARAHLGDDVGSGDDAAELRTWGVDHDQPPRTLMAGHVLGLAALARGEAALAAAELTTALSLATTLGYRHPGYMALLPDAIEASALAGDVATCEQLVGELDVQATALGLPWVDAAARRGRGLLALAAGDAAAADGLAETAATFDALGYRLDAARSVLLQGHALRRAGRRNDAAAVLADARARFARMGAKPWGSQAAAELDLVAPARLSGELTATEVRIADLVVLGRRNREIAAELFISVATVEAHLTRIYRKLGVRSRTELSRHVHPDS